MDLNKFSISGKQKSYQVQELALHNRRLIMLRWVYVSLLTAVSVITAFVSDMPNERTLLYLYIGVVALIVNGCLHLLNSRFSTRRDVLHFVTITQIMLDLVLMSFIVYILGGIDARSTILFTIPIITAGFLFSPRIVYAVAAMCGVGYIASVIIYDFVHTGSLTAPSPLVPVIFYPAVFFILAYLLSYLLSIKIRYTREQAYDTYLNMLSHSLKHPASTAAAILDLLEEDNSDKDNKHDHYIKMLKSEIIDLVDLIDNLLETASETRIQKERVDIVELIKKTAAKKAKAYNRQQDLDFTAQQESIDIDADSSKLSIAFANIIDNAFKYSSAGDAVRISITEDRQQIEVVITDEGGGIPNDIEQQALQKYSTSETLDYASQGLGLGLFVANKIILQHQGTLNIEISSNQDTMVIAKLNRKAD